MDETLQPLRWQRIAYSSAPGASVVPMFRAKVPGGWLVRVVGEGMAYVPDAEHTWQVAPVEPGT
jgi:hypothetical protein